VTPNRSLDAEAQVLGRAARTRLPVFAAILALLSLSAAFAAEFGAAGSFELPLPYRGDEVRRQISDKLVLVARPEDDEGLSVEVVDADGGADALNLLYHSNEWHGPYPTQVYAWHVARGYFPNSRWVCVRGYPVEVHITLEHPKVKEVAAVPVFQGGRLAVAWFNRPCTRGFGYESDAPAKALHSSSRKRTHR
jgi:hypothetical protein